MINNFGDKLYYLNTHFFSLSIHNTEIPINPTIKAENTNFYNIGISPFDEKIYLTDVLDYVQNGYVYQFNSDGFPLDTFEVRITPSELLFINRN